MLVAQTHVNVIWTKMDYVVIAESAVANDTFRADVKAEFEARFARRVLNLRFSEIAARPTEQEAKLAFGHGLPEVLRGWTQGAARERRVNVTDQRISGERESELFGLRHFEIVEAPI